MTTSMKKQQLPFWLGAPWKKEDKTTYEARTLERFKDPEAAVIFQNRVIDRQLNKARGLLTFNSVLLASLNLLGGHTPLTNFGSLVAILACLPLLVMMYEIWAASDEYGTPQNDFRRACKVCYFRGRLLTISLATSLLPTSVALFVVLEALV